MICFRVSGAKMPVHVQHLVNHFCVCQPYFLLFFHQVLVLNKALTCDKEQTEVSLYSYRSCQISSTEDLIGCLHCPHK